MLLWPITSTSFGLNDYIEITSITNIILETTLFITSTLLLIKTGEISLFFHNKKSNLLLAIPITTVLLPTLVSYPLEVPLPLLPPHIFYLVLFSIAILATINPYRRENSTKQLKLKPKQQTYRKSLKKSKILYRKILNALNIILPTKLGEHY